MLVSDMSPPGGEQRAITADSIKARTQISRLKPFSIFCRTGCGLAPAENAMAPDLASCIPRLSET
jgi:hypothetical protein